MVIYTLAVSYTHLDVYKRQVLFHVSEILAQIENKILMNAKILTTKVKNNDLKKSVSKEIKEVERTNKM